LAKWSVSKLSPDAEMALALWQKSAKNLIEIVSRSPGFGRTFQFRQPNDI
jgi:hypothetical protein